MSNNQNTILHTPSFDFFPKYSVILHQIDQIPTNKNECFPDLIYFAEDKEENMEMNENMMNLREFISWRLEKSTRLRGIKNLDIKQWNTHYSSPKEIKYQSTMFN